MSPPCESSEAASFSSPRSSFTSISCAHGTRSHTMVPFSSPTASGIDSGHLPLKGLSSFMERSDIKIMKFWCQELLDSVRPLLFLEFGEEIGEGSHKNNVRGLNIAEFSCDLLSVDYPDIILEIFLECLFNVLGIRHLPEAYRRW